MTAHVGHNGRSDGSGTGSQPIDMFTVEQVSRLTGLSPGQLVAWDRERFFTPQWANERGRPYGRVYSLRDVVALRTLAQLRNEHHVPLEDLRRVGAWLSERHETPWASLRFYVGGRRVYFDDPDTGMRTAGRPLGQGSFPFEMQSVAEEVRRHVEELRRRRVDDVGSIERHRHVVGNAPVLVGTRIPTSAIWNFHAAGYSTDQIIEEYPRLSPEDVRAAIAYEQERRARKARGEPVLLLIDENVPASVGRVFAERGHEVGHVLDVALPGTPDDVIGRYGDIHEALVITWNRRDFRYLSALVSPDNVRRFRKLSWIDFRCNEAHGAVRARRWIDAIEAHLRLAQQRRDTRLMIDVTERTFTVLG